MVFSLLNYQDDARPHKHKIPYILISLFDVVSKCSVNSLWLRNMNDVHMIAGHCVQVVNENPLCQELACSLRQKAEAAGKKLSKISSG